MSIFAYRDSSSDDSLAVQQLGERLLGIELRELTRAGVTANMAGVQSDRYQLTQRTDSRSIFLQDADFQAQGGAGVFEGSDDELIERAVQILVELGIDPAEVSNRNVAMEQIESASFDRVRGEIVSAGVRDGKRFALITRAIDGIPIWQSSVTLGLTRDGTPGYLQLHWPDIPEKVRKIATEYLSAESGDWKAPYVDFAEPESVQTGVLHSPPISLVMDHVAAIRVIYLPTTDEIGKRPVRYVDLDGSPVGMPRHFVETPGPIDKVRSKASAA